MTKTQILQAMARKMGVELITMKMVEPPHDDDIRGLPTLVTSKWNAGDYRGYTLMKRMGIK